MYSSVGTRYQTLCELELVKFMNMNTALMWLPMHVGSVLV